MLINKNKKMKKLIIFVLIVGVMYFGLPSFLNKIHADENYSITITSPNGGEQFKAHQPLTITWDQTNINTINIGLISDDQPSSVMASMSISTDANSTTGSYTIPLEQITGTCNNCRLQLRGYKTGVGSIVDTSDNTFTISSGRPIIKMFSEEIPSQDATAGQTNVTFSRKKIKSLNNQSVLSAIFIRLYTTNFNDIPYDHPQYKVTNLKLINEKTGQEYIIDGTLGYPTLADKIVFNPPISIQENEEIYFKLVGNIPANYQFEGPNTGKFYGYMSAIEPGNFFGYTNSEVESNPMYTTKTVTSNTPTTCTSWTYSNWSTCTNDTQTRTVVSSSPSGCTGGSPILTQSCSNGVDLIVSNIAITSNSSGQHIIATVKNIGNQNLAMNQSVILKLTFGTNISEIQSCNTTGSMPCAIGNKYNGSIAINAYGKSTLAPGEEYSITFDNGTYLLEKVGFDNSANYLIRAMVDWTDMIEESNENNNTITKSYTTTPTNSWTTDCASGNPQSCNLDNSNINTKPKTLSKTKSDEALSNRLRGKLLLDVENKGRIFYVNPKDLQKYEVTFANALPLFQKLSLGISNQNLNKISTDKSTALGKQLVGKLLLQVEDRGRIWYIDTNGLKHEVTWANLMDLFKKLSLGVNTENLNKIEENTTL